MSEAIYDEETGAYFNYDTVEKRDGQISAYQHLENQDLGDKAWLRMWRPVDSLFEHEDDDYWLQEL